MSTESVVEKLASCLSYRQEGSSIVVKNGCGESRTLAALEVEYIIYIPRASASSPEHVELGHLRKRVTERITLRQSLEPGQELRVYFGAPRGLEKVYAVVAVGDREYRVELHREEQGRGS